MDAWKEGRLYTVEDIYALPAGQRAELIDGEIYSMAPPSWMHQKINMFLSSEISAYIKDHNGVCEVLAAPFAVFLNKDDINYLEPDISVICAIDKLAEDGCHGAPDWVVEIVSPSSRSMDYNKKLFKYRSAGVREYWIVDDKKNRIMVYNFERDTMEEHTFSDRVKAGIFEGFEIDFSGLLR